MPRSRDNSSGVGYKADLVLRGRNTRDKTIRQAAIAVLLKKFNKKRRTVVLEAIAQQIFETIDSPTALKASILLREKEYAQLVQMKIDASSYLNAERFADDYLVVNFLSKYPAFKHPDLDPEKAGKESFYEFERQCTATNKRLIEFAEDPHKRDPSMWGIFSLARRKIAAVLGKPDLNRISEKFGWGPGATSISRGSYTSAYIKFQQRLDVTSNALIMGHCCINSTPAWVNCQLQTDQFPSIGVSLLRECFNVLRGNEVVFVPKNAKTHRVIAKEPHVNSYLQRGFGREMRRLLKAFAGVDLDDQTRNQRLARHGSLTGELATIDLKGASDTISTELVRLLLPKEWFKLLDMVRSKQGLLDGAWIHYSKFSSMGNGFTFELESLIFWALCKATLDLLGQGLTLSVYGDDLIVPSLHFDEVVRVLNFAGFTVNEAKSFNTGPFRESCGQDFFFGHNVRPFFQKEEIANVESLYRLANRVRRYAHRRSIYYGCDSRFKRTWQSVVSEIPSPLRYKIPEGFGDVGLVANLDESHPTRPRRGWDGWFFQAVTRRAAKQRMRDEHGGYTAILSVNGPPLMAGLEDIHHPSLRLGLRPRSPSEFLAFSKILDARYDSESVLNGYHSLRDMTRPCVTQIHTHGWYDLGPWQ